MEDGTAIRHLNGRKLPLDRSRMREVEELLLQIPMLRMLELRPPPWVKYARFGIRDRGHVREYFAELDAKGMLVI